MIKDSKWSEQKFLNVLAFMSSQEYSAKKVALTKLVKGFRERNIKWELTCSASLFFRGLIDDFNDFDILIKEEDIETTKEMLQSIGAQLISLKRKPEFFSAFFAIYDLDGISLEVFADFGVQTFETRYCYFLKDSPMDIFYLEENVNVIICPVEISFILYGMMEGWQTNRKYKRILCQEFLIANGLVHADLIKRAMDEYRLPEWLLSEISTVMR